MLRTGIEQFVGSWVSESGYRLRIEKVRNDRAVVDFLDPQGAPITRPYMGGVPPMKMIAHYDDYNEDFRVDLWEEGKVRLMSNSCSRLVAQAESAIVETSMTLPTP